VSIGAECAGSGRKNGTVKLKDESLDSRHGNTTAGNLLETWPVSYKY